MRMALLSMLYCSYMKTKPHRGFSLFPPLIPAPLFVVVETAVNIGYSCKLLDPDTRLLEWQELRLAMIKKKYTHKTHMHTLTLYE